MRGLRSFAMAGSLALAMLPDGRAALAQSAAAQAGADALSRRCVAGGGRPETRPGLVRAIRIGRVDAAVLDAARFSCAGGKAVDCGPFGCTVRLWTGSPAPVFDSPVQAWRVRGERFEVTRAAPYCAQGGGAECSESYVLSGAGLSLAGRGAQRFTRDPEPRAAAPVRPARPKGGAEAASRGSRGKFDAQQTTTGETPVTSAAPAPVVTPEALARRRRALDAAPYVP